MPCKHFRSLSGTGPRVPGRWTGSSDSIRFHNASSISHGFAMTVQRANPKPRTAQPVRAPTNLKRVLFLSTEKFSITLATPVSNAGLARVASTESWVFAHRLLRGRVHQWWASVWAPIRDDWQAHERALTEDLRNGQTR